MGLNRAQYTPPATQSEHFKPLDLSESLMILPHLTSAISIFSLRPLFLSLDNSCLQLPRGRDSPAPPSINHRRYHHSLSVITIDCSKSITYSKGRSLVPAFNIPIQSHLVQLLSAPMASSIRVAAAQMTSINDLSTNFTTCSRLVNEAVAAGVKLLCLPENFSYVGAKSGDSLKIAEPLDGPIMKKYCSLARDSNIWLSLGGFQEKGSDDSHLRNTHVLIDDSGNIRSTYRKMHLFDVDVPGGAVYKESSFTEAGREIVTAESPFGRLGLTVCYDLRFPDLYQQLRFHRGAEVLLVPAAFTKVTGGAHWEILLRARAIETQCYVIAAAQGGKHSDERESYGDSLIIDPWGMVIGRLSDRASTGIAVADIEFSVIESVRSKMPICEHRKGIEFWRSTSDSS